MAARSTVPADLVPVSISYRGRRVDVAVPSAVNVTEFLPGLVAQQGWLNRDEATRGFTLRRLNGEALSASRSLADQDVAPGTLLTLDKVLDASREPVRYDDLVEAIGQEVGAARAPWTQGDSTQLSAYSAAALVVGAAGLLFFSDIPRPVVALATGVGALLLVLTAAVVARAATATRGSLGGAMALALTAPVLLGVCLDAAVPGSPGLRLAAAGAGVIAGAAAVAVLPTAQRRVAGGPGLAGLVLVLYGLGRELWDVPSQRLAIVLVAVVIVVVLLLPWVGLAQMPVRFEGLAVDAGESAVRPTPGRPDKADKPDKAIDTASVSQQLASGSLLVASLRVGAGVALLALVPLVAVTLMGGLMLLAVCLALLLGVRSLYGRTEVYVSFVVGAVGLSLTGVLLALRLPELLPWTVGLAILVAGLVVAMNIIAPTLRPALSRAADGLHLASLIAILPLAALAWGVL